VCCDGRLDNCSASPLESRHLDVKSGSEHTNGKRNWLIQVLLREKRGDDCRVIAGAMGGVDKARKRKVSSCTLLSEFQRCTRRLDTPTFDRDSGRQRTVLLLECLADKTNPWIQGNPGGDIAHLPETLAKYVQDLMWRVVKWVPAPSMDRGDMLDTKQLRDLLQLVVAWDSRKPNNGQLAIYNTLRIEVPGPVEQEVRVGCQHVLFTVPRAKLTVSCCIVDRS
jgi:hypothetical protein